LFLLLAHTHNHARFGLYHVLTSVAEDSKSRNTNVVEGVAWLYECGAAEEI
jgi:hypothetical protein